MTEERKYTAEDRFLRHRDIFDSASLMGLPITVIGCGGIGSPAILALAKMGARTITVYDNDVVDWVNLPSQFFFQRHIDMPKVEAMKEIVNCFENFEIDARNELYSGQEIDGGIVVVAVDSIDARRAIFRAVRKQKVALVIDGRMGSEYGELYFWSPSDRDSCRRYNATLWPSGQVHRAPCTNKATTYCSLSLGAAIAASVRNHITDNPLPSKVGILNPVYTMYTEG